MFEELGMSPHLLCKLIADECWGRYDTLEYIEKTQHTNVIKLTRDGLKDIEVMCTKPYENSVTYKNAFATIDHINDIYPERAAVWWR